MDEPDIPEVYVHPEHIGLIKLPGSDTDHTAEADELRREFMAERAEVQRQTNLIGRRNSELHAARMEVARLTAENEYLRASEGMWRERAEQNLRAYDAIFARVQAVRAAIGDGDDRG